MKCAVACLLLLCLALTLFACESLPSSQNLTPGAQNITGRILYISTPTSLSLFSGDGARVLVPDAPGQIWSCALSPDGSQFAFISYGQLWLGNTETGGYSSALQLNVLSDEAWGLSWKPSGNAIALGWLRQEGMVATVFDLPTGGIRVLTPAMTIGRNVYWIDNERLLFGTGNELWIYDLAKGESERLAPSIEELFSNENGVTTPVLSHSGTMGAVVKYSPEAQIQIYDMSSGALLYKITRSPQKGIYAPTWSPDDRNLAFVETNAKSWANFNHPPTGEIIVLDIKENRETRVGVGIMVDLDWGN